MYDEALVAPMRKELTQIGVQELRTAQEVDDVIQNTKGTVLVIVNSVCGCAAGQARPAINLALSNETLPNKVVTVFAGQDKEATAQARSYFVGYPASSPSMALLKDGELVHILERRHIENNGAEAIANHLISVFEENCK
ncbi:MAG: BrxA/BrxB family bacilliredoxin [Calditrichaeota bacterium]|nr:MAG: BrxA/BrxB family bacilliredoxin [Calditrichota bacterium]